MRNITHKMLTDISVTNWLNHLKIFANHIKCNDVPNPRSIKKSFFSSGDPGWPSRKFSGLTSP